MPAESGWEDKETSVETRASRFRHEAEDYFVNNLRLHRLRIRYQLTLFLLVNPEILPERDGIPISTEVLRADVQTPVGFLH